MQQLDTKAPAKQRKHDSRQIRLRITITGSLALESPTHLGNGDAEGLTDLPLLLDSADTQPVPLLQGTSIAGALRGYLQARQHGYHKSELGPQDELSPAEQHALSEQHKREHRQPAPGREDELRPDEKRALSEQRKRTHDAILLFGGAKGDEYGDQSPLIVDDALGALPAEGIEVRDGVRIDGATRTAEDKFKYDLELLPAGTTFPLRFELLIGQDDDEGRLLQTLALALQAFEQGAITLGARKSRGFGRCAVSEWTVTRYDLLRRDQLLAWLAADHPAWGYAPPKPCTGTIAAALAQACQGTADATPIALPADPGKRSDFTIVADFALASPLLIRSEEPLDAFGDNQPDFIHLRNSKGRPILPGTSAAGALRARATRIVNTLGLDNAQAIDCLFGKDMQRDPHNPTASRLIVEESAINQGTTLVQNRVAIDRFTGGALDTALFSEAPQVGGDVRLKLVIRDHPELSQAQRDAERGLLLLLLKDLWTSDLPLGGTSSIGRGRLRGCKATITDRHSGTARVWAIEQVGEALAITGDQAALEVFVQALGGKQ